MILLVKAWQKAKMALFPKPNLTYDQYLHLEVLLPLLFPVIFPLVLVVILVICVILAVALSICGCSNRAMKVLKVPQKSIVLLLGTLFGPPFGLFSYESASITRGTFYIGKKKVPMIVIVFLGVLSLTFINSLFVVFWELFLLDESYVCDDKTIDCFLRSEVANKSLFDPVPNCSLFDGLDVEFICYRFSFSIGVGLAGLGGLFSALKGIVKAISVVAFKFYGYIPKKNYCEGCISSHTIAYLIVLLMVIAGGITALFAYFGVASDQASVPHFLASYYKFIAIISVFVFGAIVPWQTVLPDPEYEELRDIADAPTDQTS